MCELALVTSWMCERVRLASRDLRAHAALYRHDAAWIAALAR
jgi:hypothetical protein